LSPFSKGGMVTGGEIALAVIMGFFRRWLRGDVILAFGYGCLA